QGYGSARTCRSATAGHGGKSRLGRDVPLRRAGNCLVPGVSLSQESHGFSRAECQNSVTGGALMPLLVATFSIVGCDLAVGELGVAVQSKFLAVGAVVPW